MALQWFVNVQDTARLHVSARLDPDCNSERIFASAATFNGNDVLAALRKLYRDHKLLNNVPGQGKDITEIPSKMQRVGGFVEAGLATGEFVKAVDGI
ncbi:hypothetical protein LTR97_012595 [Elasticomyces elasticus]|uniref:Uncharacterized protein n=1 Tax=Elasticomyces elasticus TaxID=574655 RepID=A0AAN7W1J7_9PEZI|nr:hypothetical protein LTR97_012595 [Elasticomyces elasticus]